MGSSIARLSIKTELTIDSERKINRRFLCIHAMTYINEPAEEACRMRSALFLFVILTQSAGCYSEPVTLRDSDMPIDPAIANAGAIVCSHVANGSPILRAARDSPVDPNDSGWQFLCDSGVEEQIDGAQVWSVKEVARHDASVLPFINSPKGTTMSRSDATSEWKAVE